MLSAREQAQREYYDKYADRYDKKITRRGERNLNIKTDTILSFLTLKRSDRALCVGCGTGIEMMNLMKKINVDRLIGIDSSSEMLRKFKEKLTKNKNINVELIRADVYSIPLESNSIDSVFGIDIIHHLDAPVNFIKEILRILKEGGKFSFIETNAYHPFNIVYCFNKLEKGVFRNTKANLERWFKEGGGNSVEVGNVPLYFPPLPKSAHNLYSQLERIFIKIPIVRNFSLMLYVNGKKTSKSSHDNLH